MLHWAIAELQRSMLPKHEVADRELDLKLCYQQKPYTADSAQYLFSGFFSSALAITLPRPASNDCRWPSVRQSST